MFCNLSEIENIFVFVLFRQHGCTCSFNNTKRYLP